MRPWPGAGGKACPFPDGHSVQEPCYAGACSTNCLVGAGRVRAGSMYLDSCHVIHRVCFIPPRFLSLNGVI